MVTLHETEVDGVRCFWVETGRPTLASLLVFRFGMLDENLNESGWQHLLEHMALHDTEAGALHTNGSVSLMETVFEAHGPADAVSAHLVALSTQLAQPRFDELSRERDVLRAEADVRGSSASGRAIGWRYGATGPGVVAYSDPALGRATEDALAARAHRAFNRDNGVLMLDGPPPPGLRLHLPEGERVLPRPARPCEQPTPAAYQEEAGLVLSGVVSRTASMSISGELLRQAVADKFRHEAGTAYAPWVSYERVDAEHAVLLAGTDVQAPGRPTLVADAIEIVHSLSERGPDPDKLAEVQASQLQSLKDPYATFGVAVRAGHDYLRRRPTLTLEQMAEEIESTDVATVQQGFRELRQTLLLGVPGDAPVGTRLPVLEFTRIPPPIGGRRFRHRNWPAVSELLVMHPTQLEMRHETGSRVAVFQDLVGMFAFEDGRRHLVRSDGYGLTVDPSQWHRGQEAVAELDRVVPASLHLPHPADNLSNRPPRLGWFARWRPALTRNAVRGLVSKPALFLVFLATWIAGFVAIVKFDIHGVGPVWAVLGGAAVFGVLRSDHG